MDAARRTNMPMPTGQTTDAVAEARKKLRLLKCLQPSCKIALIFLHTEFTSEQFEKHRTKLGILRQNSVFTCAADGGSNFLYDYYCAPGTAKEEVRNPWLPNLVCGDFDSARPEVLDYCRLNSAIEVVHAEDQDETDFTKALKLVIERVETQKLRVDMIVAFCNGIGRLDHTMGNINTLFRATQFTNIPVVLMSGQDIQYALSKPGDYELVLDVGLEGDYCGLIPCCGSSLVTTSGLQWDLDNREMSFGELVSTSNAVKAASVIIKTDKPLLWTMTVK